MKTGEREERERVELKVQARSDRSLSLSLSFSLSLSIDRVRKERVPGGLKCDFIRAGPCNARERKKERDALKSYFLPLFPFLPIERMNRNSTVGG